MDDEEVRLWLDRVAARAKDAGSVVRYHCNHNARTWSIGEPQRCMDCGKRFKTPWGEPTEDK